MTVRQPVHRSSCSGTHPWRHKISVCSSEGFVLPELRKDPIVGRWVIISTDRAKRPTDFVRENLKIKGGFCPFCYGNETKTPPEIQAYRPNPNGGPAPQHDTPGWTVRVVPNKFPALGIEGTLNRQAEGMFDRMNGVGAHEVIIETPDHTASMATLPPKRIEDVLWPFRDRILDLKKDRRVQHTLRADNAAVQAHGAARADPPSPPHPTRA